MPEIRNITHANTRFALVEDPNPSFNRLWFDGQAVDLNTLTPSWQKQFMFNVAGQATYCGYNFANGTFWDGVYYNVPLGPQPAMTRNQTTGGITDVFPISDNSWHRLGYIQLQKGTISTYAMGDRDGPWNQANKMPMNTLYGVWDTYWHSLDFATYPTLKAWKSPFAGFTHWIHPSEGVSTSESGANLTFNANKRWGWFVYNSDVSVGPNNSANTSAIFATITDTNPTHFIWEDTQYNLLYTFRALRPLAYNMNIYRNYNSGNNVGYYTNFSFSAARPFFIGVDAFSQTYFVTCDTSTTTNNYNIFRYDPRALVSTTLYSNMTRGVYLSYMNGWPSNIRRANSNTIVFYTGHWLSTGPAPIRVTFDPVLGNVFIANCNVAYPGSTSYSNYAAFMNNNGTSPSGAAADGTASHSWMVKPHQIVNSGNIYLTYWLVDQMAFPTATLTSTPATDYTSNGQLRWGTTGQRTMVTFQANTANDSNLTYHSSYTFPATTDIPKNFMPINANNTLMAAVSYNKTTFLAWNNNTGWSASGTYNQEFRMLGMDSTNRIWGYAMDKNNGSIHVITPSLSVNVVVTMAASNYTYTGTIINTSATVNAFDFSGSRIAANVSLTIDGTTMTFADGSKQRNILTSASGDTSVALQIYGGGVNNIYAYA